MPKGVYERTSRHRLSLSLSAKKRTHVALENIKKAIEKNIGRKCSQETKNRISMANKGKKRTSEMNDANRNRMLGHVPWNKGKKNCYTPEQLIKIGNKKRVAFFKGRHHTEEAKKKLRILQIKRIEKNYGISHPNYNLKACEFFRYNDFIHRTKGQYAVYGGGEYLIRELGYYIDYINHDLKMIIEWDEPHHYDKYGDLKMRDQIRQQVIQKHLPDYEFFRIKEH